MIFRKLLVVIILFLAFSTKSNAQIEKANNFFNNFYYAKAIPLYAKAAKKEKYKIEATQKLADCYRILHDYQHAEIHYAKVIEYGSHTPIYHLYYGQMLFNNGHLNPAKEQFTKFSELSSEDKRSQNLLNSIIITRLWSVKQPEYSITNLKDLNTIGAEFCAVPYNKNIVFVSDRGTDFVNYTKNPADSRPYLSMFLAERGKGKDSTKIKKIESFSPKINNEYHNGPGTFVESGRQLFFTRVDGKIYAKKSEEINRPRIYFSTRVGSHWDQIRPLAYNSDNYSTAHPAISADGTLLIFSSDMPGGYGGKDLYACKLEGANWAKPVNLGAKINSPSDEVFPYLHKDGTLYFSSDGHIGFGGLDLYSARFLNNEWSQVRNLQEPINSTYDDFGISFLYRIATGYFSSNRPGGIGGDDVYSFELLKTIPKITAISGKIFQNELDFAKDIEVKLIDDNGVVVAKTKTDSVGVFNFEKLNPEENYIVMLDAEEVGFNKKEGTHFHGRLFYNQDMPAAKAKLIIKNREGVSVKEIETDISGYFRFDFLKYEDNDLDSLEDSDVAFVKRELHKYQQLTTDNIIPDNLDNEDVIAKLKKLFKYDELLASQTSLDNAQEENTEFYVKGDFVYNKLRTDSFALSTVPEETTKFYIKNNFVYNKLTGDAFALKTEQEVANQFYIKNGYRYDKLSGDSISLEQLYADNDKFYIKKNFRFNRLNGDSVSIDKLTEEDVNFSVYSYTLKARIFADGVFQQIAPGVKVTVKDGDGKIYQMLTTDKNGEIKANFLPLNKTYVLKVDQDNEIMQNATNYSVFGRVMNSNNTKFPVKGKEISFANMDDALYVNSITDAEGFFKMGGKTEKRVKINLLANQQDSLNGLALNDGDLKKRQAEEERIKLIQLKNTSDNLALQEISDEDILKIYGNKTVRDLTFTTQVGAYKMPDNFAYKKIENKFGKVQIQKLDDNITRFTVQAHATINSADSVRNLLIKEGVKDAFVTAIYKGKRYLLRDLIKLGIFTGAENAYIQEMTGGNFEKPKDEKLDIVKPINTGVVNNVSETSVVENKTKSTAAKIKVDTNMDKLVNEYGDVIVDKAEYRVQVGAFKLISGSYQYKRLQEVGTVDKKEHKDGIMRYTIGHCETLREADKIRRQVVKVGVSDAFIVVIKGSERYTIFEAIKQGVVKK